MATPTTPKPCCSKEAQKILSSLQQPAVFLNMTCDWPALNWTAEHLSVVLGDKTIQFRLAKKKGTNAPVFETQCCYLEAKLAQFLCWSRGNPGADTGPFSDYPFTDYWAYADYKYIALLFQDHPSNYEDIRWSDFGFHGRNGRESTLWIGTEGANTPCHLDSYGCNLVLQVQGRKRWHLYPPEDTSNLYPTRIPYEESSVFSQVDVLQPDLLRFPAFSRARAHIVTLQPGQVLFVPRQWWHYVESVDPVTVSVNTWIELEADNMARVSEAVTKAVVCALKTTPSHDNQDKWLNPTEEGVESHDDNMKYVNLAMQTCMERHKSHYNCGQTHEPGWARPVKQQSSCGLAWESFTIPFGPCLIPVHREKKDLEDTNEAIPEYPSIKVSKDCPIDINDPQNGKPKIVCEIKQRTQSWSLESDPSRPCKDRIWAHAADKHWTEDSGHDPITTNDLLDCLTHPDVMAQVTELLLERQRSSNNITKAY